LGEEEEEGEAEEFVNFAYFMVFLVLMLLIKLFLFLVGFFSLGSEGDSFYVFVNYLCSLLFI